MAYVLFNPNPKNARVGDCAVRAVSKAVGQDWADAYIGLCAEGIALRDMPSSNYVWGMYLNWNIINEVMEMLKTTEPNIYRAVIHKLIKLH